MRRSTGSAAISPTSCATCRRCRTTSSDQGRRRGGGWRSRSLDSSLRSESQCSRAARIILIPSSSSADLNTRLNEETDEKRQLVLRKELDSRNFQDRLDRLVSCILISYVLLLMLHCRRATHKRHAKASSSQRPPKNTSSSALPTSSTRSRPRTRSSPSTKVAGRRPPTLPRLESRNWRSWLEI
jgi:hypothetical protein